MTLNVFKSALTNSSLFRPPGTFMRRVEGGVVCIAALSCFLAYYLVNFDLCQRHECASLEVTLIYYELAEIYIAFGFAMAIAGVFLFRDVKLIQLQRLGIELTALIGAWFAIMSVFAILRESNTVTG